MKKLALAYGLEANTSNTNVLNNASELKTFVEKVMTDLPKKINRIRDVSSYFSIEEAVDILKTALVCDFNIEMVTLIEKGSVTVVVCATISLTNSQIESLKNHYINAASVGPVSGGSSLQSIDVTDKSSLPVTLFTTPEYFDKKLKNELVAMKENIKLLVLDDLIGAPTFVHATTPSNQ